MFDVHLDEPVQLKSRPFILPELLINNISVPILSSDFQVAAQGVAAHRGVH